MTSSKAASGKRNLTKTGPNRERVSACAQARGVSALTLVALALGLGPARAHSVIRVMKTWTFEVDNGCEEDALARKTAFGVNAQGLFVN